MAESKVFKKYLWAVFLGFIGFYYCFLRVLLGFIDFSPSNYWILLGFIGFYWIFSISWTGFGLFSIFALLSYFLLKPFSLQGFMVFYWGFSLFWMIWGLNKKNPINLLLVFFFTFLGFFFGHIFWVRFFWPSLH